MILHARTKWFMIFWYTVLCIRRQKSIEKAMKFPLAYETDVANLDGSVSIARVRLP
jgi:hypothetical protein